MLRIFLVTNLIVDSIQRPSRCSWFVGCEIPVAAAGCPIAQKLLTMNAKSGQTALIRVPPQTIKYAAAFSAMFLLLVSSATAAPMRTLHGHVPEVVAHLQPSGRV